MRDREKKKKRNSAHTDIYLMFIKIYVYGCVGVCYIREYSIQHFTIG